MFQHLKQHYSRSDQRKALDLLHDSSRYPGLRALNLRDFRLQLYVVPSFQPYISWSLFAEESGDYVVRRVRWDSAADYYLEMGDPTLYGTDSHHRGEEIEPWLQTLQMLAFPAFDITKSFGIDGTTFGLRQACFAQTAQISWWCRLPEGWKNLADWYHSFVDVLESQSPAHTDRYRNEAKR